MEVPEDDHIRPKHVVQSESEYLSKLRCLTIPLPSVRYHVAVGCVVKSLSPGSFERFREGQTKTVTAFLPFRARRSKLRCLRS
jgi:hypothetical protein